jgi:anti-sigma factor RsiW
LALRGSGGLERVSASKVRMRGFTVLLWRDSDLGYALVSDLGDAELVRLGNKISAAAPQ